MSTKIIHDYPLVRWLPKDPELIWRYHRELVAELIQHKVYTVEDNKVDEKQFSPVILEFKKLIEEDSEIRKDFDEMFVPKESGHPINCYMVLLAVLNDLIAKAPPYEWQNPLVTGVPVYAVIAPFANTQAGYHAFTNAKVNAMILKMFNEWSKFLVSPASCNVLVKSKGGWFSDEALEAQSKRLGEPFEDVWVCNPGEEHYGFPSWDEFFVRRFRKNKRPVMDPDCEKCINNPCEAIELRYVTGVKATDTFWIKEQPYSLFHSLNFDPLASQFVGGTVYQAVLSALDYHRWHSPINGRVVKAYVVPGAYYAPLVDAQGDMDVITNSIFFQTTITTRAFIYIESDNPEIGLMCFVGVGLVEVSTCRLEVKQGDVVKKGDEIGSFRFGGSTILLVFRPQTLLKEVPGPEQPTDKDEARIARKLNTELFYVTNP